MAKVFNDYNNPKYLALREKLQGRKSNGHWQYSHLITDKIAPLIDTDREIDALGLVQCGCKDGAIVFIHANINLLDTYSWLRRYDDLILVCNNEDTAYKLSIILPNSTPIVLPLSVDVEEVLTHQHPKTKKACYAGNIWPFKMADLEKFVPEGTPRYTDMERDELLDAISEYEEVYAVGITAVEAAVLGCEIKVCDSRFPDPTYWKPLDYKEAAKILQKKLDEIDKEK